MLNLGSKILNSKLCPTKNSILESRIVNMWWFVVSPYWHPSLWNFQLSLNSYIDSVKKNQSYNLPTLSSSLYYINSMKVLITSKNEPFQFEIFQKKLWDKKLPMSTFLLKVNNSISTCFQWNGKRPDFCVQHVYSPTFSSSESRGVGKFFLELGPSPS